MLVVDSIERKQPLEGDKCFRRNAIPLGLNQLRALSTLFEWKARTAVRALWQPKSMVLRRMVANKRSRDESVDDLQDSLPVFLFS
jgi:hypothetical protein